MKVGTSGSTATRLSPQPASARSLPDLMCGSTTAGPEASASTCPPRMAVRAGRAPAAVLDEVLGRLPRALGPHHEHRGVRGDERDGGKLVHGEGGLAAEEL